MSQYSNHTKERQSAVVPSWSTLLTEAVNKPGQIMRAYSAFHPYSIGNQLLALMQCTIRYMEFNVNQHISE